MPRSFVSWTCSSREELVHLRPRARSRRGSRGARLWYSCETPSRTPPSSQGVGIGVPGDTRSFHFSFAGSRGPWRSAPRARRARRRRLVGHGRGEVLVRERGEVVAELVDEDVRRPEAVGGDRAVLAEDPAAAVGPACSSGSRRTRRARTTPRRGRRGSRRSGCSARCRTRRRSRRAATGGGRPIDGREMPDSSAGGQSAHTLKSLAPRLEGLDGEEQVRQPPRVLLELAALGRGVAVAEDQEVDLRRRARPLLLDGDDGARRGRRGRVDEDVFRVDA